MFAFILFLRPFSRGSDRWEKISSVWHQNKSRYKVWHTRTKFAYTKNPRQSKGNKNKNKTWAMKYYIEYSTCCQHFCFFLCCSQILFSNIEEILDVHQEFFSVLEAGLQPEPQPQHALGHVFLQFVSLLFNDIIFDLLLTFIWYLKCVSNMFYF